MSHRVVYVENSRDLKLYLDSLKVVIDDNDILIPLSDVMILLIDNYKSILTVPLINKLTEYNVCTILCGVDHLPQSMIVAMNGHFEQSGNINKQIHWNEDNKKLAHKLIVQSKIRNQRRILELNNKNINVIRKLDTFIEDVQLDDETNREGLAAKMYFREIYGGDFIRMNDDVINAGLNYGYAIFRSLITSVIISKGYLANIGIFHKGKQNRFNLSDDVIEVFRPIIDQYVYENLMDEDVLTKKYREELIQLTLKKIEIDNKKQTISNAVNIYFESILNVLETGDVSYFIEPLPYCYDL